MPNLNVAQFNIPGGSFKFSAVRPEHLTETEYTLVTIAVDISGSVEEFDSHLIQALKDIIKACRKSPKADNLLVRVVLFQSEVKELHGFRPISDIDEDKEYILNCGGGTALFDASYDSVVSTTRYAEVLYQQDFSVNGIVFIITDGDDNNSKMTAQSVHQAVSESISKEEIDSLTTVLVGVNLRNNCDKYLDNFSKQAELNAFIDIGDASPEKFAKLANFVSKSISSASKSLGTGASIPKDQLIF
jgi:uncharacterized protein YegL